MGFKRDSSELNEKRQIINFLFRNLTLTNRKLGYELKNPFTKMDFSKHCSNWLPDMTDFRMACHKYDQVYGDLLASFIREHLPDTTPLKNNNVKNPLPTTTVVDVPQESIKTPRKKDDENSQKDVII